jgi:dihydropyrimidinase
MGGAMSLLIRNGKIVTASDTFTADLLIEGEQIVQMGSNLTAEGNEVIDATGLFVFPGAVDPHVHNDEPFMGTVGSDDFFTGTVAAACGGTTTTIDFAYQTKGKSLDYAFQDWMNKAAGKAVIDYGFHIAIFEGDQAWIDEMPEMVAKGVTSFKAFMAYKGDIGVDDSTIFRMLQKCRETGAILTVHAENGDVIDVLLQQELQQGHTAAQYFPRTRPSETEGEATSRVLALAHMAGAPVYIVHISAAEALDAVTEARRKGQIAFAETTPHYLFLTEAEYERPGFEPAKYICAPPIRSIAHQEKLWLGLETGAVQAIGSDHCTYNYATQKILGINDFTKIPAGIPGIETRLYLLWNGGVRTGRITPNRFVELVSTNPAKIFGLYPQKGALAIGSDADLVLWNADKEFVISQHSLHQNIDYTPYEGWQVIGAPEYVLARGKVIVHNNQFLGEKGVGRYLKRKPFRSEY